jgi:hypothetical protein
VTDSGTVPGPRNDAVIEEEDPIVRTNGETAKESSIVKNLSRNGSRLSALQRQILAQALAGRVAAIEQIHTFDVGGWTVTLCVPIDADRLKLYTDALTKFRRWMKHPCRMRAELVDEGYGWTGYSWPDEIVAILESGVDSACSCISAGCQRIRNALPDELATTRGHADMRGISCERPSFVCKYSFPTREEADAFRDRHGPFIETWPDHPGSTLTVEQALPMCRPDLLVRDAVLLAGDGTRSGSAEAVASRAIARLERRGLVETGRACEHEIWFPRALWLTDAGLSIAGEIAPETAARIGAIKRQREEERAAEEEKRRAERDAWEATRSPEEQAEAERALSELQATLARLGPLA